MGEHERVILEGDAEAVNRASARRTRRSFVVGGVAAAAGYSVFRWIDDGKPVGRLQAALRETLQVDAAINRAVFGERGLAPEYPASRAKVLRLNGVVGMDETLDLASWRLQLAGVANAQRSPLYAKDVTAWEYKYAGDMQPDSQALDVKSAPKSEARVGPGDPQPEAVDAPKMPEKKVKANSLNPTGAEDSAAGAALAARIEAMTRGSQPAQTKRVVGHGGGWRFVQRVGYWHARAAAGDERSGAAAEGELLHGVQVRGGMERDHAVGRVSAAGFDGDVSAREDQRARAAVCVHGDAGRRLLLRLRHEGGAASAEPAGDGDERPAADAGARRSAAAAHADQVRL